MRVMAVDFGDARTGVAVSDATKTLVGDAWITLSKKMTETAQKVVQEAATRDVSCIVVGLPKNMDGSIGPRAEKSKEFAELLGTLTKAEIKLWDERLTTVSANRVLKETGNFGKKQKNKRDAIAAAIILESYLGSL
jgi:putative Holliday junction resolvase